MKALLRSVVLGEVPVRLIILPDTLCHFLLCFNPLTSELGLSDLLNSLFLHFTEWTVLYNSPNSPGSDDTLVIKRESPVQLLEGRGKEEVLFWEKFQRGNGVASLKPKRQILVKSS